jgi:hypothetical protein
MGMDMRMPMVVRVGVRDSVMKVDMGITAATAFFTHNDLPFVDFKFNRFDIEFAPG